MHNILYSRILDWISKYQHNLKYPKFLCNLATVITCGMPISSAIYIAIAFYLSSLKPVYFH